MRGIIFAAGGGAKPLLPVYDKPMIYYSLSALMLAGIRTILVVATPGDTPRCQQLLGGGERWGIRLSYALQPLSGGAVQALVTGSEFTGDRSVALILANHIFYGNRLSADLQSAAALKKGARVVVRRVDEPEGCASVCFDKNGRATGLVDSLEKGSKPQSRYAVTGLGFYDNTVGERARALQSSRRTFPDITDLNRAYLEEGALSVSVCARATTWLDIGGPDSLLAAARRVETAEQRCGVMVGCPEEAAWRMGFIDDEGLLELGAVAGETCYGRYLRGLVGGGG